MANSHKTLSGREDDILLAWVVDGCYDIPQPSPHINVLGVVSGLRGPTMKCETWGMVIQSRFVHL